MQSASAGSVLQGRGVVGCCRSGCVARKWRNLQLPGLSPSFMRHGDLLCVPNPLIPRCPPSLQRGAVARDHRNMHVWNPATKLCLKTVDCGIYVCIQT